MSSHFPISEAFSRPNSPCLSDTTRHRKLRPLLSQAAGGVEEKRAEWARIRPEVEARWRALLGTPSFQDSEPGEPCRIAELETPEFRAVCYRHPTGAGLNPGMGSEPGQKIIMLHPPSQFRAGEPAPCAIVPFYHPEQSAGLVRDEESGTLRLNTDCAWATEARQIGRHLARLGFVVACVEAFPFNTVPDPGGSEPFAWWRSAADALLAAHPAWTGLGKLVHDTSRALDLLLGQPGVDYTRVLAMGHSLGGKMAFYTGALDARVSCVIGSDFGLPWRSTNWDAPWYLGARIPSGDEGMAHHELLALLAPRPFFLLAGETDGKESWEYLDAAREVYSLYGASNAAGCLHHDSGHTPPVAALDVAYAWLCERFSLPHRHWRS